MCVASSLARTHWPWIALWLPLQCLIVAWVCVSLSLLCLAWSSRYSSSCMLHSFPALLLHSRPSRSAEAIQTCECGEVLVRISLCRLVCKAPACRLHVCHASTHPVLLLAVVGPSPPAVACNLMHLTGACLCNPKAALLPPAVFAHCPRLGAVLLPISLGTES